MTAKNSAFYKIRRGAIVCLAAGVVLACSSDGDDKVFEGDRISVLSYDSTLRVDPRLSNQPVRLLPPFQNSQWSNPGGFATHVAYHLDLSGLNESFRVEMVAGNVADRRLKSPPVIGGGKVFAMGSALDVSAVDSETGAALWTTSVAATYSEPNFGFTRFLGRDEVPADIDDGFGGGVAYENGRLFVTTGFGEILALSAETGEIIWRVQNTVPFSNAPTIRNGNLFVVSQDSRLQVLSTNDGRRLWSFWQLPNKPAFYPPQAPLSQIRLSLLVLVLAKFQP